MTPEQFQIFLERNDKATEEALRKHVNGKIDAMRTELADHTKKHDAFMEDVKPILQAYQGGKLLGEGVKWVAGVGAAYLIIKGFFKL